MKQISLPEVEFERKKPLPKRERFLTYYGSFGRLPPPSATASSCQQMLAHLLNGRAISFSR